MNPALNNGLHIADVIKTFGAHGELLIRLRPEAPDEINLSEPVFLPIDGYAVPFYFKRFEARGNHRALVVFDDMETMELAQELVGKAIEWRTGNGERNNPTNSFSLLHYNVVDKTAGDIGAVAEFIDIPGNPCLQLNNGAQEILIPFREEMMTVDHKKKTITTDLPAGLVDLNRKP
jgi:ribosomal 30S subunit maturation factor RimM